MECGIKSEYENNPKKEIPSIVPSIVPKVPIPLKIAFQHQNLINNSTSSASSSSEDSLKDELEKLMSHKFLKNKELKIYDGENFIFPEGVPQEKEICEFCQKEIPKNIISSHIDSHPSKILDWLYLGSNTNATNKKELDYANIKYILNCAYECSNNFKEDFTYKKFELEDNPFIDITQYFEESFTFLEEARQNNSIVFVHCILGKSRSATFVIAYLMKYLTMSYEEAYNFVKARRRMVFPNMGFMRQLKEFEKSLY